MKLQYRAELFGNGSTGNARRTIEANKLTTIREALRDFGLETGARNETDNPAAWAEVYLNDNPDWTDVVFFYEFLSQKGEGLYAIHRKDGP